MTWSLTDFEPAPYPKEILSRFIDGATAPEIPSLFHGTIATWTSTLAVFDQHFRYKDISRDICGGVHVHLENENVENFGLRKAIAQMTAELNLLYQIRLKHSLSLYLVSTRS